MTDQRQHTHDQWTPSVPSGPEQAGPDWTGSASSTQSGPTEDLTDPQRPAEEAQVTRAPRTSRPSTGQSSTNRTSMQRPSTNPV
jgi:hypothetical protein